MRTAINLIIHGVIIWAAWQLFPEIVQIDSMRTLIIATLLLWLISLAIGIGCLLIMGAGFVLDSAAWVIIGLIIVFVMVIFADVIGMYILSGNLEGFAVAGFWPKVLLSLCLSLFSTGSTKHEREYRYNRY